MFPSFGQPGQPPDSGIEGPFGPPAGGPPSSDGFFADFSDDLDGFLDPVEVGPGARHIDDCIGAGLHFFDALRDE